MPKVIFRSILDPGRPEYHRGYEVEIRPLEGEPGLKIDRPRQAMFCSIISTGARTAAYRVFDEILPDLNEGKRPVEVYMDGPFDKEDLEYIGGCMERYSELQGVEIRCVRKDSE